MVAALDGLLESLPDLELWHQTGDADFDEVQAAYRDHGLDESRARVGRFIRDMAEPYAWCDMVVCRAGATSLAELAVVGCPALLVPFPHATDNHQEHNARQLVDAGAAVLLRESELTSVRMVEALVSRLGDRAGLRGMRRAMSAAGRPQAAQDILRELMSLAD
jgi:UDP-N-acetylglucosamine--N-acetylmuramyl-(pentapeptide) pyrophosphoryl-undecaprenol N-acetylglucosamine transferase